MRVLPIILGTCLLAGCKYNVPFTEFDQDRQYRVDLLRPTENQSSQDTVLRIMGPADAVSGDHRAWAYQWRTYSKTVPLIVVWDLFAGVVYSDEKRELRLNVLLLEFDANQVLTRQELWSAIQQSGGLPSTQEILEQWHAPPKSPPTTAPAAPS